MSAMALLPINVYTMVGICRPLQGLHLDGPLGRIGDARGSDLEGRNRPLRPDVSACPLHEVSSLFIHEAPWGPCTM